MDRETPWPRVPDAITFQRGLCSPDSNNPSGKAFELVRAAFCLLLGRQGSTHLMETRHSGTSLIIFFSHSSGSSRSSQETPDDCFNRHIIRACVGTAISRPLTYYGHFMVESRVKLNPSFFLFFSERERISDSLSYLVNATHALHAKAPAHLVSECVHVSVAGVVGVFISTTRQPAIVAMIGTVMQLPDWTWCLGVTFSPQSPTLSTLFVHDVLLVHYRDTNTNTRTGPVKHPCCRGKVYNHTSSFIQPEPQVISFRLAMAQAFDGWSTLSITVMVSSCSKSVHVEDENPFLGFFGSRLSFRFFSRLWRAISDMNPLAQLEVLLNTGCKPDGRSA